MEEIIGNCAYNAIAFYAQMSGHLYTSEAFIKDRCASEVHTLLNVRCSTELPIRDFVGRWALERSDLADLGNFRVDMAVYNNESQDGDIDVHSLVEFKLWTDRFAVQHDVDRLRHIIQVLESAQNAPMDYKPKGYVVVAPQYHQGIAASSKALHDLGRYFQFSFRKDGEIVAQYGREMKLFGVGVAVIEVVL